MSARTWVIAATVAGLLAAGACGSTSGSSGGSDDPSSGGKDGYDAGKLASQIRDEQQAKVPDLKVKAGTCPAKPKIEKGSTFECTVVIAGVEAPYTVQINSVTDSKVNFAFKPAKAIVSVAIVEKFLEDQLASKGMAGVAVACSEAPVVVQDPGTTFPCTLSKGNETQKVAIAIKDIDGKVAIAE